MHHVLLDITSNVPPSGWWERNGDDVIAGILAAVAVQILNAGWKLFSRVATKKVKASWEAFEWKAFLREFSRLFAIVFGDRESGLVLNAIKNGVIFLGVAMVASVLHRLTGLTNDPATTQVVSYLGDIIYFVDVLIFILLTFGSLTKYLSRRG